MRLNGLKTTEREKTRRSGPGDRLSGSVPIPAMDEISFLSTSLSTHARFFSKLRTNIKKRIRIMSVSGNRIFKRGLDVCGSLAAIILLLPFFLVIAVWLKLDSPGPLIYRQVRIGLHGRPFYFYKFRSM